MLFTTSGYMLATVYPACCICIHVQTAYLHVYHKAACRGPSSQVFACMLAALLSHNSSVTCMLTCKQIGVSIGCGKVVKSNCVIKSGLLANWVACAQEFEAGFCSHSCLYRFFWRGGGVWHVCLLPCICIQASLCSSGGDMGVTGWLLVLVLVLKLFKPVPLRL